ncbi:MAG: hypothetical protein PVF58_01505 [Candidatus Methanofastidiosia archaeon]
MVTTLGKISIVFITGFILLALLSAVFSNNDVYDPITGFDMNIISVSSPSVKHPLGTDFWGRDIFSQICSGAYHAFLDGLGWSIVGIPVLVGAAYVMAQLREKQPRKETFFMQYMKFGVFPLCVTCVLFILNLRTVSLIGLLFMTRSITLFFAPVIALLGWFAVGHELEAQFRKKERISNRLLLSGAMLIFSYAPLYDGMIALAGIGDPTTMTWGTMIELYFSVEYTFTAPFWLISPIVCIYVFSRCMLAASYWLYNYGPRERYFIREGWV